MTRAFHAGVVNGLQKTAGAITNALIAQTAAGVGEIGMHGPWAAKGQSFGEAAAKNRLQEAQSQLRKHSPGTPEYKDAHREVMRASQSYHGAVQGAEMAGSGLGMAGAQGLGLVANRLIGRSLLKGEAGARTTAEQAAQLAKHMGGHGHFVMPHAGIGSAVHIPKGGAMPRILRPVERMMYERMDIPKDVVERGFKAGISIVPEHAGRHVGAHELGHAAFGASLPGKIHKFTKARMVGPMAGLIGSAYLAGTGDPDSAKAKWLAPAVALAGLSPVLGEEAIASIKGYRAMKALGASAQELKHARRQLAKAWGTYGALMTPMMLGAPLAIRAVRKYQRGKRGAQGLPTEESLKERVRALAAAQKGMR